MKTISAIVWVLLALGLTGCEKKVPVSLSSQQALAIAAQTKEAQAIMAYRKGVLASCLEKTVVRSCDSQWVTCRDDAWVVQYVVTAQCPVIGDGRLGMNFVIDGSKGTMISHYPELEYFMAESFCRDDGDCVSGFVDQRLQCLNFIAAPFANFRGDAAPCRCQDAQCILKR